MKRQPNPGAVRAAEFILNETGLSSKARVRKFAALIDREIGATEMRSALEAIDANWCIRHAPPNYSGPDDPRAVAFFTDRTIETWRMIRAALAKARGEA